MRGELTGLQRATLGALVVMDVHARDVVGALAGAGVSQLEEFEWQAQLRTYWQRTDVSGGCVWGRGRACGKPHHTTLGWA